jgi:trehalose 6-phosphate phosphatase
MPLSTRKVLDDLGKLPNLDLAIVSARGLGLLKRDIDDSQIILAGNYGMEICMPDGQTFIAPGAENAVAELKQVLARLAPITHDFPGAILEDHGYSICLHWHAVARDRLARLNELVTQLGSKLVTVLMRRLPTSYEFLPNIYWDKSLALDIIAAKLPLLGKQPLFIYIGDSEQDEPAFAWANNRGGFSIRVGAISNQTNATHHIAQPIDVALFLEHLQRERLALAATAYSATDSPEEREKKIESVFNRLKADYALRLPERISDLELLVEAAKNKADDLSSLTEASQQLHRLKGTIGSYGFSELSNLLGEIETALQNIELTQPNEGDLHELWLRAAPKITNAFAKAQSAARSAAADQPKV